MQQFAHRPALIVADRWRDYQLLDCGDGLKQERWGDITLVRPDPQIIWPRHGEKPGAPWTKWDGFYHRAETGGGRWEYRRPLPDHWTVHYEPLQLTFKIHPTSFKHTGLFPEQAANWDWFSAKIRHAVAPATTAATDSCEAAGPRSVNVLNLFGYTGAASVAAAKAGASVCHVDAAEGMVKWARENAALSGLAEAPIRYIVDDCLKFVRREQRRGRRYDAIIMDPPTYGRGATGEMWKLEDHLWELLTECRALLSEQPLFFLINAYTARLSPTVVANLLAELLHDRGGQITAGEVGLPIQRDGKTLPCGIYGRWES
ncbi:class I SAM-dependent methyltransferase [Horticoccus luteus]|uniref:Class I SAM-dependent methyltransferase n=1 Tax=Horticoccus luteus TaxID=2862869 RepID=A0A8F9XLD1_9BACT|nr:class I SAM-dependent methyltransferase [Horticoccus luteus]QYM78909.1 class I SAM-dependent methyltransferase [Horticoccus luteus]